MIWVCFLGWVWNSCVLGSVYFGCVVWGCLAMFVLNCLGCFVYVWFC